MPPIEKQNTFASVVKKVEDIKAQYQLNLAEIENLYGDISQKAFKGELDLSRIPLEMPDDRDQDESSDSSVDDGEAGFEISHAFARKEVLAALKGLNQQVFTIDAVIKQLQEQTNVALPGYEEIKEELFALVAQGKAEQRVPEDSNQLAFVLKD